MIQRRTRLDGLAVALMLTCCFLWGVQQVVVKATLPALPPFLQGVTRSAIAALLLWCWSLARGIGLFERDGTLLPGLAAGTLFGCEFLCIYGALPLTDASRVTVFVYLAPFVVALCLPRFEPAERLDTLQMGGLLAAFLALAYAFQEGFGAARPMQWIGDGLAILAACMWGATTLVVRTTRLASTVPEKTLFYQLVGSTILLGAAALVTGEAWPATGLSAWTWTSLAFQSAVVAFASFLAWFWLLRHYPATRLSAFSFLTPVFGLIVATFALGESISVRLGVAMGFIALGIALVNRKPTVATTLVGDPP